MIFQEVSTLSAPAEGDSRNESCALNLLSMFLLPQIIYMQIFTSLWIVVVFPFTNGTSGSVDVVLLGVIPPAFVNLLSILFLVSVLYVLELSAPLVDGDRFGSLSFRC